MNRYKIEGGHRLYGTVDVHGSKNAALPILAACVINNGKSIIHNCPDLSDIRSIIEILELLGCKVTRHNLDLHIDSSEICSCDIPACIMNKTRSSTVFAGALAARCKRAPVSGGGGCKIGSRPIDIHLAAFEKMGMKIIEDKDSLFLVADNLHPCDIELKFPSVGATENIMLASSLTEGITTIKNAAKEPEIINLADYLRSIGVVIKGDGSDCISIRGTSSPGCGEVSIIPDRIVAATYIGAVLASGGDVCINSVIASHISPFIACLRKMGCELYIDGNKIRIISDEPVFNLPYVQTMPYPGFPTDCQPILTAIMSFSKGNGIIKENIFEQRFGHCDRLKMFGADIETIDRFAYINGVQYFRGADVDACDLRSGAALCIAALKAEGISHVSNVHYIERGYEDLCTDLSNLGARIERCD